MNNIKNSFINYLNNHIKNIRVNAEKIANLRFFDAKTLKNSLNLNENQTFYLLKELSDANAISLNLYNNTLTISVKNPEYFVNYICVKRQYETQVMYLNLCGSITTSTLQEVFSISEIEAQILYSKLLANDGCLEKKSNDCYTLKNIGKALAQIGGLMNLIYRQRYAV